MELLVFFLLHILPVLFVCVVFMQGCRKMPAKTGQKVTARPQTCSNNHKIATMTSLLVCLLELHREPSQSLMEQVKGKQVQVSKHHRQYREQEELLRLDFPFIAETPCSLL